MEVLCERLQMKINLTTFVQKFKKSFWTCSKDVNTPLATLSLSYPLHLHLSLLLWTSVSNFDYPFQKPTLPGHSVSQSIGTLSLWSQSALVCPFPSHPNSLLPQTGHYDQMWWLFDLYTPFFDVLGINWTEKTVHHMTLAPHGFIQVFKRMFLIVSHKQCISILHFPIWCTWHVNLLIHSSL